MNPVEKLSSKIEEHQLWENQISVKRNHFLHVSGRTDVNVYFIESGSLRIFVTDNQEEHTIRFGYRGNMIAALDSFLTGQPSELNIQAIKKTELKVISKDRLMGFIEQDPEIFRVWLDILSILIFQQMERERDILTTSPKERYLRVLERSPKLFQEIPNKYIASYLRMSPETLSRMKKS